MSEEENEDPKNAENKAREPVTAFRQIQFFDSFEEQAEHTAKQRAAMSYDERMRNIEQLRKRVFHEYLLPNDQWPSISKTYKIMEPYVSKTGK